MTTVSIHSYAQAVEATIGSRSSTTPGRSRLYRLIVSLLILTSIFGLVSARSAEAAEQVPFDGSFTTSHATVVPCGPVTVCITLSGVGEARHLGRAEFVKNSLSTRTSTPCSGGLVNTYTASLTLTAADGDIITMSGSGTVCEGPGLVQASGIYTVTGGTGRFSGASGTIAERFERVGAVVYVSLTGTIASVGSVK
jgi:hypothetical protein